MARSDTGPQEELPATGGSGHILVVDDDAQIRQLVGKLLREHGFRVTTARDGREMRAVMDGTPVDLVVLDLMLPGTDGLDLCRSIRRTSSLPVIMLTARGSDTDRIVGLEIGADDYVAKPFNPRELLARVNAVLRRARGAGMEAGAATGHVLSFGGWRLDTRRRELTSPAGAIVDLSTGEYDLLLTFLEQPQRPLSREQLLGAAKNRIATGFDRAIDIQVSRLRKKIDTGEDGQTMIRTIRGTGYMFVPEVERS
jgi:two-component system, OmpR family, response regulator